MPQPLGCHFCFDETPTSPICSATCEPDPTSATYASTALVRTALVNERGSSSKVVAIRPLTGEPGVSAQDVIGSESYNYAIPILNLPGRNGLNLNLTLYYNSHVWTLNSSSAQVTFNADRDFPSYGFQLGFGYLEKAGDSNSYTLTEADGTKRSLTGGISNVNSSDGSSINYVPTTRILIYKNGTRVLFEPFPSSTVLFRPIRITDTNGNYISISYGTSQNRAIATITDTLGRQVQFNYENGLLASITQRLTDGTTKTHATFPWKGYQLNYSFSGLQVEDSPAQGSVLNVLAACRFANGTGFEFGYGDWGIVNEIDQVTSTDAVRSSLSFNYPSASVALSALPTYTQRTLASGGTSYRWAYVTTKSGAKVASSAVTNPDGTQQKTILYTDGSASDGYIQTLQQIDAGGQVLSTVDYTWNGPYVASLTTTLDSGQKAQKKFTYGSFGNITAVDEYDYDGILKRTTSYTYGLGTSYTAPPVHIQNRPTQILVKDGSGTIASREDIAYDTTSVTGLAGTQGHDDSGYGSAFLTRGNPTQITRYKDPASGAGAITATLYSDIFGNVVSQTACSGCAPVSIGYNYQSAYPTAVTYGSGSTRLQTSIDYYFDTGLKKSATDVNQLTTTFAYDEVGRLWQTTQQQTGVISTTAYDDASTEPTIVTSSSAANTAVSATKFDGFNRPIEQQVKNGSTTVSTTYTEYDSMGRAHRVSNPTSTSDKIWTTYDYDGMGRVKTITPPGATGSYQNTYSGSSVLRQDPAGKQTAQYYDALGRLANSYEPGWGDGLPATGAVTIQGQLTYHQSCSHEPPIQCVTTATPSGTLTLAVNGVTKSVAYGGLVSRGSVVEGISAAKALANAINSDSSYPATAVANGSTVNLTLKTVGDLTYSLDAYDTTTGTPAFTITKSGSTMTGGVDTTQESAPFVSTPVTTTYTYSPLDQVTQVDQGLDWWKNGTRAPAQTRTYAYDGLGRLTSETLPENNLVPVRYTYNDSGTVYTRTDPRGVVTTYGYDGVNRLKSTSYAGGAAEPTPSVSYTYSGALLQSKSYGTATETYSYDSLARLKTVTTVIDGTNYAVGYDYDNLGRLSQITYPSQRTVGYDLDALGRLKQVTSNGLIQLLVDPSAGYNAANQLQKFTLGSAVNAQFGYTNTLKIQDLRYSQGSSDLLHLSYDYNVDDQIQTVHHYDAAGNEDLAKTVSFEYDLLNRLASGHTTNLTAPNTWQLQWKYDRFGNRLSHTLNAGTLSAYQPQLNISGTTNHIVDPGYTYSAGGLTTGNLTNDGLYSFSYDGENRLVKAVQNGLGDPQGSTYAYDDGALRIKKTVGSTTTTVYIYANGQPVAEYVNGALSQEYLLVGSSTIASFAPDGSVSYMLRDHLSIRALANANGNQTGTSGHLPFGDEWYSTGAGASKWKFTTYERDAETGVDYAMYRNYNYRIGRFLQVDPARADINNYAYTMNDPINLVDPLGLDNDPITIYYGCIGPLCSASSHQTITVTPGGGGSSSGFAPSWGPHVLLFQSSSSINENRDSDQGGAPANNETNQVNNISVPYNLCVAGALYRELQSVKSATAAANKDIAKTVGFGALTLGPADAMKYAMTGRPFSGAMLFYGYLAGVTSKTYMITLPIWANQVAAAQTQYQKDVRSCGKPE